MALFIGRFTPIIKKVFCPNFREELNDSIRYRLSKTLEIILNETDPNFPSRFSVVKLPIKMIVNREN